MIETLDGPPPAERAGQEHSTPCNSIRCLPSCGLIHRHDVKRGNILQQISESHCHSNNDALSWYNCVDPDFHKKGSALAKELGCDMAEAYYIKMLAPELLENIFSHIEDQPTLYNLTRV